jgi:iron complex transport system permease protein
VREVKLPLSPYLWCGLALFLAFTLSVALGPVPIGPLESLRILLSRLPFLEITRDWPSTSETILLRIRLPDAIRIGMTGAALGASGAAYQGLFRNPLADPYLIGVAPGAGLGAVIAMVFGWPAEFFGLAVVPAAAFLGALATVALVYSLARVGKSAPVTTLLLSGVAVGAFASALTSFLMLERQLDLRRVFNYLQGGFSLGGWYPVLASLPYIAVGLVSLALLGRPLNVLQFGDEQALQMGLNVERAKLCLVLAASLAAGAAVAFSGLIGFVGLAVPHLLRQLWGSDYRRLLPLSILGGAAALLLADTAGRAVRGLEELPVGIITALLGAPFFLYLLRRVRQSYW